MLKNNTYYKIATTQVVLFIFLSYLSIINASMCSKNNYCKIKPVCRLCDILYRYL